MPYQQFQFSFDSPERVRENLHQPSSAHLSPNYCAPTPGLPDQLRIEKINITSSVAWDRLSGCQNTLRASPWLRHQLVGACTFIANKN